MPPAVAVHAVSSQRHVLIGGGSGFIGSALATALVGRGDRVTLISRTAGPGRTTWDDLAGLDCRHAMPWSIWRVSIFSTFGGGGTRPIATGHQVAGRDHEQLVKRIEREPRRRRRSSCPRPASASTARASSIWAEAHPELDEDLSRWEWISGGAGRAMGGCGRWRRRQSAAARQAQDRRGAGKGRAQIISAGCGRWPGAGFLPIRRRSPGAGRGDRKRQATASVDPHRRHGRHLAACQDRPATRGRYNAVSPGTLPTGIHRSLCRALAPPDHVVGSEWLVRAWSEMNDLQFSCAANW